VLRERARTLGIRRGKKRKESYQDTESSCVEEDKLMLLLRCTLLTLCMVVASCFPSLLLDKHCDRDIQEGVVIMGKEITKQEEGSFAIRVYRVENGEEGINEMELANFSTYKQGESLLVSVFPRLFSLVLESRGARWEKGQCEAKNRVSERGNATLLLPAIPEGDVEITGVWTKSFSYGVKLLPTFTLRPPNTYEGEL